MDKKTTAIHESYCNTRLVSYLVLHDKFGFGQKRIERLESAVDEYLDDFIDGKYESDYFDTQLRKRGIYVREIVAKIPARVRLRLAYGRNVPKRLGTEELSLISESLRTFFAITLVALIKVLHIPILQIKDEYLKWMQFNFECLAEKNRLTIDDIVAVLAEECGYVDRRYKVE